MLHTILAAVALFVADPDPSLPTMAGLIERYRADLGSVRRFHDTPMSASAVGHSEEFHQAWLDRLNGVDFQSLDVNGRAEHVLLREHVRFALDEARYDREQLKEIEPLVPFTELLVRMLEARRQLEAVDQRQAAETLDALATQIAEATKSLEKAETERDRVLARRAAIQLDRLAWSLRSWFNFYDG